MSRLAAYLRFLAVVERRPWRDWQWQRLLERSAVGRWTVAELAVEQWPVDRRLVIEAAASRQE